MHIWEKGMNGHWQLPSTHCGQILSEIALEYLLQFHKSLFLTLSYLHRKITYEFPWILVFHP